MKFWNKILSNKLHFLDNVPNPSRLIFIPSYIHKLPVILCTEYLIFIACSNDLQNFLVDILSLIWNLPILIVDTFEIYLYICRNKYFTYN